MTLKSRYSFWGRIVFSFLVKREVRIRLCIQFHFFLWDVKIIFNINLWNNRKIALKSVLSCCFLMFLTFFYGHKKFLCIEILNISACYVRKNKFGFSIFKFINIFSSQNSFIICDKQQQIWQRCKYFLDRYISLKIFNLLSKQTISNLYLNNFCW